MEKITIKLPNRKYLIKVTKNFATCYVDGRYIATHLTKEDALKHLRVYDESKRYLYDKSHNLDTIVFLVFLLK